MRSRSGEQVVHQSSCRRVLCRSFCRCPHFLPCSLAPASASSSMISELSEQFLKGLAHPQRDLSGSVQSNHCNASGFVACSQSCQSIQNASDGTIVPSAESGLTPSPHLQHMSRLARPPVSGPLPRSGRPRRQCRAAASDEVTIALSIFGTFGGIALKTGLDQVLSALLPFPPTFLSSCASAGI